MLIDTRIENTMHKQTLYNEINSSICDTTFCLQHVGLDKILYSNTNIIDKLDIFAILQVFMVKFVNCSISVYQIGLIFHDCTVLNSFLFASGKLSKGLVLKSSEVELSIPVSIKSCNFIIDNYGSVSMVNSHFILSQMLFLSNIKVIFIK